MRTVLICDDDALVGSVEERMLSEAGWKVVTIVSNAIDACDATRALRPDLVVLDSSMAGLSGIEAIPELVEHTTKVGNQLYEMSLKTGASVENLSALRFVASQTGIDFESFGTTLFKMEKALGANGDAADQMQKHLDVLHLDLQTLKNEKPDQAFIDIMSALEQVPNRMDQAAVGAAIVKVVDSQHHDLSGTTDGASGSFRFEQVEPALRDVLG